MALNATIDLTVKKPDFKSMKSEIRELTVAAQQAVMQFGEFSPEAVRAEQALAGARDRMEDFNDRVAAVNPDKFAQINTVVQGVARGFQAAQGAMALFGNDSKDLEKTMIKLQGAMALAEGLEGLGKVQQQFSALANTIKGKVVQAFSTLRGAITASGIGLLAISLGYVVANFEKVSSAITNAIPGLAKFGELVGQLVQNFTDFIGVTSEGERQLAAFTKTVEANKTSIQGQIDVLNAQGNQEEKIFDLREQLIDQDIALIDKRRSLGVKLTEEQLKEENQLYTEYGYKKQVLNAEEVKFYADKNKALTDYLELFVKDTEKINDDADKSAKEAKEIAVKDEYQLNEEHWNRLQELTTQKLNEDTALLQEQYDKDLEKFKDVEGAKEALQELYRDRADALQETYNASRLAQNIEYNNKQVQLETKSAQQISDAKLSIAQSTVEGLTALNGILTAEDQKRQNIQKAIALVEIGIDTAIAVSSLNAESAKASAKVAGVLGPATPVFTAAYYAQGIVRILANVAKAKQVLSGGKASGGGGGGAMGINAPAMSAPNISSSLPTVSGFDTKVFVTEGDIRRTTDRVDTTRKVSVVK